MSNSTDSLSEIQARIGKGEFSARQIMIVLICFLANFVDGFDVIAIAMSAPIISKAWNIPPELLGYILSAELVGMAIGAVILSALSDRYGRRTIFVPSILLVACSTFATAFVSDVPQLILARISTGFGVGGVISTAAILASEYSPARRRSATVTLVTMGFAVGSLVPGFIAPTLFTQFGWQSLFIAGSAMGGVVLILAFLFVPESLEFKASQNSATEETLKEINRTLAQIRLQPLEQLVVSNMATSSLSGGFRQLFAPGLAGKTILLWAIFFAMFWANYSVGKWLPGLLVTDGFALDQALFALTIWVLGSISGSLIISVLTTWMSIERIISGMLILSSVTVFSFAIIEPSDTYTLYPLIFVFGFGLGGALTGLYTLPVAAFPTHLRTLGLGTCIGIGRTGAIIAPIIAGYLVGSGMSTGSIFLSVLLPSILIALALLLLKVRFMTSVGAEDPVRTG